MRVLRPICRTTNNTMSTVEPIQIIKRDHRLKYKVVILIIIIIIRRSNINNNNIYKNNNNKSNNFIIIFTIIIMMMIIIRGIPGRENYGQVSENSERKCIKLGFPFLRWVWDGCKERYGGLNSSGSLGVNTGGLTGLRMGKRDSSCGVAVYNAFIRDVVGPELMNNWSVRCIRPCRLIESAFTRGWRRTRTTGPENA